MLALDRPEQPFAEVDLAAGAERRHRQPGPGVEADQAMPGVQEDAQGAAVAPGSDAAMDEALAAGRLARLVRLRIERPELLAGRRLERDHAVVRRAHVEHAVDHQRRVLERARKGAELLLGFLAGLPLPGHLELRDVLAGDAGQRRVLPAAGIAAVDRPLTRLLAGAQAGNRRGDRDRGRSDDHAGPRHPRATTTHGSPPGPASRCWRWRAGRTAPWSPGWSRSAG